MPLDDSEDKQKPRERKLSTDSNHSEGRMRTRSFSSMKGTVSVVREFVGDEMDKQLQQLKLVKKAMPKDNSSIFRAVCEQVSSVQTDHEKVRILVEEILKPIARRFFLPDQNIGNSKYDREKEIFEILANITSSRITVFRSTSEVPDVFESAETVENREILVCDTQTRGVYDSVYSEEIHEGLAISQAIVYQNLYENVFNYEKSNIKEMINYIRYDNDNHAYTTVENLEMVENDMHMHGAHTQCMHRAPQFPFCVCKSLDPAMYRNVEFSMYKRKTDGAVQAAQNSLAVKFGMRALCLARDGGQIRQAKVIEVMKPDVRRVIFEDGKVREFDVSDLRPIAQTPVAHHNMHTLMSGTGRGGAPMTYLPGCMAPMPPFQSSYGMPPPHLMNMGGPPPSPSPPPFFCSLPPYAQQILASQQNQPPLPMDRGSNNSIGYSPADSSMDNSSVFPATPLSSRRGEDGRRNNAKPRALSVELTDSPVARGRSSHTGWYRQPSKAKDGNKGMSRRRATEGDTVLEMNRPLQPKKLQMTNWCTVPESGAPFCAESPALPSLMDAQTQQMQQLQLHDGAADTVAGTDALAAARAKLPSLLPPPQSQTRASFYASSEWTGSDTVFKDGEGSNSQLNLSNTHDAPLLSSSSLGVIAPPPQFVAALENVVVDYFAPLESITVPYITPSQLEAVDKSADFSQNLDGEDLPDKLTTRFFYNMGLLYYRKYNLGDSAPIEAPSADDVPMPPHFFANSPAMMPPNSAAFFPMNMPNQMFHPSAAPPNTPMPLSGPPMLSLPPHIMQYCNPGVDGMPTFGGYPNYGYMGAQMMEQGSMAPPSPSPMMPEGQVFFPNK